MRELTTNEIDQVSGGEYNYTAISTGVGLFSLGIAIALTGGVATVPIAFLGAATASEIGIGVTALTLAGAGGATIGAGITGGINNADGDGLKDKDS